MQKRMTIVLLRGKFGNRHRQVVNKPWEGRGRDWVEAKECQALAVTIIEEERKNSVLETSKEAWPCQQLDFG